MIMMELVLFEGPHSIMRTELKIASGNALIIVGPHNPHETFITAIGADTVAMPASEANESAAAAAASAMDQPPVALPHR